MESQSVFMEVRCVCRRCLNVDGALSASAPHPEGDWGERGGGGELFYFTFGMTATPPESCLKAKKLCSSIILKTYS